MSGGSGLANGWETAAIILLIAVFVHEPWRWFGLYLGRDIDVGGEVFQWVKAVATALVAGLVMRLVLFPAGALGGVPLGIRLAAFAGGVALFYAARRNLSVGVAGGTLLLVLGSAALR